MFSKTNNSDEARPLPLTPELVLALTKSPDSLQSSTGSRLKESMAIEFLLRFNVTLRHLLMRYYYQFYFSS